MNSNIKAIVDINGNQTNEIDIKEAVRQGTILEEYCVPWKQTKYMLLRQPTYTMVHPEIPIESLISQFTG